MGPFRLLDEVGFDVALHVEKTLRDAFGDRVPKCDLLQSMVNLGMLGRKNNKGFYVATNNKEPQPNPEVLPLLKPKQLPPFRTKEEMAQHLNNLMRNEAMRCLEEGVAASASDIELAMMLGTGYPPFRELFPHSSEPPVNLTGILPAVTDAQARTDCA